MFDTFQLSTSISKSRKTELTVIFVSFVKMYKRPKITFFYMESTMRTHDRYFHNDILTWMKYNIYGRSNLSCDRSWSNLKFSLASESYSISAILNMCTWTIISFLRLEAVKDRHFVYYCLRLLKVKCNKPLQIPSHEF